MKSGLAQPKSVLGIEIGDVHTRGHLFDIVENSYRLIASSYAPTTSFYPILDIGDAIYEVLSRIQEICGRTLIEKSGELILPALPTGDGVDQFYITTSCFSSLQVVAVGLLNDVSLDSARKLCNATYANLLESIGINDRRSYSQQLDTLLTIRPDLVIFTGGTDGGASRSLLRTAELVSTALQLLPRGTRPQILYCGNQVLSAQLKDVFERYTTVRSAPNIRPSFEGENLEPALIELDALVMEKMNEEIGGLKRISPLCTTPPQLKNQGFMRMIKFLGRQYDPLKGVLGLDVGMNYSMAAYSNDRVSILNTFNFGIGSGLEAFLRKGDIKDISRWLTFPVPDTVVSDALWNRSLFPLSVAATKEEIAIEQAVLRQMLQSMMIDLESREIMPSSRFEPIVLSGCTVSHVADPVRSLLLALDGIQPLGISPLILDKHSLLPLLGTIAAHNPLLAVQLLESTAFSNLATVVNITSKTRAGSPLLYARLDYADGNSFEVEVKQGSIISLPLAPGATGLLRLRLTSRAEIEELALIREPIKVQGGVCGVVVDARGRPIVLPEDQGRRIELLKEWEFLLGAA